MSNKNILYPTKICIESYLNEVYDRVYNQLPLEKADYPFLVYEIAIIEKKMQLTVDVWDNRENIITTQEVDMLIAKLDYMNNKEMNLSVHFCGQINTIIDIPTSDEELSRIRLVGEYDLYKA